MELRLRLYRINGDALRLDFPPGLSHELFWRADRSGFFGLTPKIFTDQHEAETVHPRIRCSLVLWDVSVTATQSNSRSHLWVWCPGWQKAGRMNRGRFRASFPWSVSAVHIPTFSHRLRIPHRQRTSRRARHFPTVSAQQLPESEIAGMMKRTLPHLPSRIFCRNPPQGTSKFRAAKVDRCRSIAFQLDDSESHHPSALGGPVSCAPLSFDLPVSQHGWHASPCCLQASSQTCRRLCSNWDRAQTSLRLGFVEVTVVHRFNYSK